MLKDRLKGKAIAQPEMSCSSPCGASSPWGCSGRGRAMLPAWASKGRQLAWLAVAPLQLPLCAPEGDTDGILKRFVLSKAKHPAQP